MGKDVSLATFTREDRTRYRQKVRRCLDVFALMLNDFRFDADRPMTGLELELNLMDVEDSPRLLVRQVNYTPYSPLKENIWSTTMEKIYLDHYISVASRPRSREAR